MEKLFVQIFERKRWIVDQVRHQTHLFDQHLASTLLIDGIPPPPWLLPQSHTSGPDELRKEELISGLLFPYPQVPFPYSSNHYSLNGRPIPTAANEQLGVVNGVSCNVYGKSVAGINTSVLPEFVGTHEGSMDGVSEPAPSPIVKFPQECGLNGAPELLPTPVAKGPIDQTEEEVPDTYHGLEQSLARVQRSKSRQRDLQLRNSVKASRSSLHYQCDADFNPSTDMGSRNACLCVDRVDDMEMVKPLTSNCKVSSSEEPQMANCRSADQSCRTSRDGGVGTMDSGLQPLYVDESLKHGSSRSTGEKFTAQVSESSLKSNSAAVQVVEPSYVRTNAGHSLGKHKYSSIQSRRITRSQRSIQPHPEDELLRLPGSCTIGGEASIPNEIATSVNSTERLDKSGRTREAELEFRQIAEQLNRSGNSRLHESHDIGIAEIHNSEDKSMQFQKVDAHSGQAIRPLNPGLLCSRVSQPTLTASCKPISGELFPFTDLEHVSNTEVDRSLGKRGDSSSEHCDTSAVDIGVASEKLSEDFAAPVQSNFNNDDDSLRNDVEVVVSGLSADRSLHVEPMQLDFDGVGESKIGLNEDAATHSEERRLEVSDRGHANSVYQQNEDRNEPCSFTPEAHSGETGEGGIISRPDTAVPVIDVFKRGSLSSHFSVVTDSSKDKLSMLANEIANPLDGENEFHHPLDVVEASSLSHLQSRERMDFSEEKTIKQLGSAEPYIFVSREGKVEHTASLIPKASVEVKGGNSMVSNISGDPDQILGEPAAGIHCSAPGSTGDSLLTDMDVDSPLRQGAEPVENCMKCREDVNCSESDDRIMESSVQSKHMSNSYTGGSWLHSRQKDSGSGQAKCLTDSSAWEMASMCSPHEISHDMNSSGVECHQGYVPSPEEINKANDDDAICAHVICNTDDLKEQKLEDYAVERFRFSPVQQDEEGDPRPLTGSGVSKQNATAPRVSLSEKSKVVGRSGNVHDAKRKSIEDELDDQAYAEDKFESGDVEGSAFFEEPVVGKLSCLEESSEPSSCLAGCSISPEGLTNADQIMPVLERFVMQEGDEQLCLSKSGCSFEKFDLRDTIVERASLMEQLCRSLQTPSTHLATADNLHEGSLNQSVPNGLLEYIDFKNKQPLEDDNIGFFNGGFFKKEVCLDAKSFSDFPFLGSENGRKPYLSPVGKLWEKIASNSGSSKHKASLNPELPCINEENEIADEAAGASTNDIPLAARTSSAKRKPLADITEDTNCRASVSDIENHRCSVESVNTEVSFTGTSKRPKPRLGSHMSKSRHINKMKNSKTIKRDVGVPKIPMEPLHNRISGPKMSLRKDGIGNHVKEAKRGNIVCNVTSFVPFVQQKQAAAPLAGKRDVKVKSLEAAEAARRQAEEKEVKRQMKREAMKLERARVELENLRQLELQKKRKEEEKKKKEAEMAARKRLREEEEKREKEKKRLREEDEKRERERKRKRVEGQRRHQEDQKEKLCSKKEEKEMKTGVKISDEKKVTNLTISENEAATTWNAVPVTENGSLLPETPRNRSDNLKEQSYEISPYHCSDDEDEDEDEDDDKRKKFIPSWASKNRIALAISSQHGLNPDVILPPYSFCSIDEVVLPQKLQQK